MDEAEPSTRDKVVILGGGPNRIGQGIEFDYCCCHAAFALSKAGTETIMVNCNPETVSTDYDTSDRLYFEPLTAEDVLEIIRVEQSKGKLKGVIVQFGGQTPLKLAGALEAAGVPILGTSPDAIDLAEDRDRFKALIERLGLMQPDSAIARTPAEARAAADALGYPVMIRPSYVLGGRAMEIVADGSEIDRYVVRLSRTLDQPSELAVSDRRPLLIDRYLSDAIEVDVDCLSDGKDTFVAGIMEHIEEAGIHSGDSACALPPHSLPASILTQIEKQTRDLALALKVVGLMNVQFAVKGREIYILEVNPRASRTVPFVAKVIGKPIAGIAARIMNGEPLASFGLKAEKLGHVAVKEAVFPFARFPGVDTVLGPEMRSTGEVMGIDRDHAMAFAKSQLGSGTALPLKGGRVRVRTRCGQGAYPGRHAGTRRHGLSYPGDARNAAGARHARHSLRTGQQGAGRPPSYRRHDEERRRAPRFQHHRRRQSAGGFKGHPPHRLALPYSLLYNIGRRAGGDTGHQSAGSGHPYGGTAAILYGPCILRMTWLAGPERAGQTRKTE